MRRYAFEEGRAPIVNFYRDTERALLLGVCAGLAERLGWDLTIVRLAAVVLLLVATVPVALLYVVVGVLAPAKRLTYYGERERCLWRRSTRRRARHAGR